MAELSKEPNHKEHLRGAFKDLPSEVRIEAARILDLTSSCGRLSLVIHRIAEKDSPELLTAWQTFLTACDAAESLSYLLDYGPVDFEA